MKQECRKGRGQGGERKSVGWGREDERAERSGVKVEEMEVN